MSNKVFNFKNDLASGIEQEEIFVSTQLPDLKLKRLGGTKADFISEAGQLFEYKADFTNYSRFNFFFETVYDKTKDVPAGPWKAARDGCEYFIYQFVGRPGQPFYLFETVTLLERIDELVKELNPELKEVKNPQWTGLGYALPVDRFLDIALPIEDYYTLEKTEIEEW